MPHIANESLLSLISSSSTTSTALTGLPSVQESSGFKHFLQADPMAISSPKVLNRANVSMVGNALPQFELALSTEQSFILGNAVQGLEQNLEDVIQGLSAIDIEQLSFGASALGVKMPALLQDMLRQEAEKELPINATDSLVDLNTDESIESDVIESTSSELGLFEPVLKDGFFWQQLGIVNVIPASEGISEIDVNQNDNPFQSSFDGFKTTDIQTNHEELADIADGTISNILPIATMSQMLINGHIELNHPEALPEELKLSLQATERGTFTLPVAAILQYFKQSENPMNIGQGQAFADRLVNQFAKRIDSKALVGDVDQTAANETKAGIVLTANDKHLLSKAVWETADDQHVKNLIKNPTPSLLQTENAADQGDIDLRQMEALLSPRASQASVQENASLVLSAREMSEIKPVMQMSSVLSTDPKPIVDSAMLSSNRAEWFQGLNHRIQWMLSQNIQKADIRVDPPELGSVHIRIQQSGDQTSVVFTSQHAVVREALENTLPRLRELMEQQGFNLVQADVKDQHQDRSNNSPHDSHSTGLEQSETEHHEEEVITTLASQSLVDTHV